MAHLRTELRDFVRGVLTDLGARDIQFEQSDRA